SIRLMLRRRQAPPPLSSGGGACLRSVSRCIHERRHRQPAPSLMGVSITSMAGVRRRFPSVGGGGGRQTGRIKTSSETDEGRHSTALAASPTCEHISRSRLIHPL